MIPDALDARRPREQSISPACDAVMAAEHPAPEAGGPCASCAFRPGTEANKGWHTVELARLCVEGLRFFECHEKRQTCRGFNAAINLRGVPTDADDKKWCDVAGHAADILSDLIARAKAEDQRRAARPVQKAKGA